MIEDRTNENIIVPMSGMGAIGQTIKMVGENIKTAGKDETLSKLNPVEQVIAIEQKRKRKRASIQ